MVGVGEGKSMSSESDQHSEMHKKPDPVSYCATGTNLKRNGHNVRLTGDDSTDG